MVTGRCIDVTRLALMLHIKQTSHRAVRRGRDYIMPTTFVLFCELMPLVMQLTAQSGCTVVHQTP